MLHRRDGARIPPDVTLGIQVKEFNLWPELWSSIRVTIGFLVTSLTKPLLSRFLNLAGRPALGRVLMVPNFFHLRMMEATVFLGTSMLQKCFGTLPQILSRGSTDNSLDLMAWFLL